jgi:hypothetical protein
VRVQFLVNDDFGGSTTFLLHGFHLTVEYWRST